MPDTKNQEAIQRNGVVNQCDISVEGSCPANSQHHQKNLKIVLGPDNFRKIVTESDVLVDKSLFIKEVIDSGEEAILITHPRRWGKTLNLDMLKTFFEPESKECQERKEVEDKVVQTTKLREDCRLYHNSDKHPWAAYRECYALQDMCDWYSQSVKS